MTAFHNHLDKIVAVNIFYDIYSHRLQGPPLSFNGIRIVVDVAYSYWSPSHWGKGI